MNLDVDVLCSVTNPSSVHFIMREWWEAESPSIYWNKKLNEYSHQDSLEKINLGHFYYENLDLVPLIHGLPLTEALTVCKDIYKNNIAKVTIEISEKSVMMTRRDFSVTFAEQLSIISM